MVLFLKGRLETLNYFIDNMALNTPDCHILNVTDEQFLFQLHTLDPYINETTNVITFNNTGIEIDYLNHGNYWDMKQVHLYNIQVDTPLWYRSVLKLNIKCMQIVSVDKTHAQFIQKYFPSHPSIFLPHGGVSSRFTPPLRI